MRVTLEHGLTIGWAIHSFKAGERSACVAVKSTYQLQHGAPPVPADEPEPVSGDRYTDDDPAKSLLYPNDLAPLKPRADVIVLATAHAPGNQPAPRFAVRIKVGPIDKALAVFGPRVWRREWVGRAGASEPQPTVAVPVDYENAFGGPTSRKNPVGRGVDSDDLPQIEDPRRLATSARDAVDPAGFGPIAAGWQPRAGLVGKYDDRWLKSRWPWFPEDFDYGYFNAAPRDQQIEGYLKGDEELVFEGLHAKHASYQSRLPGRRSRCFLQEPDQEGRPNFREVPLKLDTVWVDLNTESLVLVWRGHVPVRTPKLREVAEVLAWTEPLAEPPRPASYCPEFLAERKRAEAIEWDEDTPEEVAAKKAEEDAADAEFDKAFAEFDKEMAATEKEAAEAAAGLEAKWAVEKAALIAAGADPSLLEPNPAPMSQSEALRATIREMQARSPDDAALLQQQLADVEKVEAESAAMDKEFAAEFRPDPTREDVLAAIERRQSLAEWDMSGMDLAGLDLSGLDCRRALLLKTNLQGATLRKADLTGARLNEADLSGADLSGAVLNEADLTGANLSGAKLTDLSLDGTDLSGLNFAGADFVGSSGRAPDFSGADLTGAHFVGVKLANADFSKAKLERADFRFAEIPRADLDGALAARVDFEGADISGMSASDGADFADGNFKGAKAAGAVFGEALLDRANFTRAVLTRAQFSDASLEQAVFDRADLSSAAFDGAVLKKAVLTKANLMRAGFDQADLTEADFRGSNLYEVGLWEAILDRADFRGANVKGTNLA